MLILEIGAEDGFDEKIQEFVTIPGVKIELEHSLLSLSKWESEWEKPFLDQAERNTEETISYIKAMTLTPNIPPELFSHLSEVNFAQVNKYISAKMSATWFAEDPGASRSREIITSELIYYWMIALTIPFECQSWHLNRLLTLIRVCNQKNQPKKKMSRQEAAAQQRKINAERQAQYHTSG